MLNSITTFLQFLSSRLSVSVSKFFFKFCLTFHKYYHGIKKRGNHNDLENMLIELEIHSLTVNILIFFQGHSSQKDMCIYINIICIHLVEKFDSKWKIHANTCANT